MSILKRLHSSVLVGVVFLLTGTRPGVTRVLPSAADGQDHGISASISTDLLERLAASEGGDSGSGGKGDDSGSGGKGDDSGSGGKGDDSGSGGPGGGDGDNGGGGG